MSIVMFVLSRVDSNRRCRRSSSTTRKTVETSGKSVRKWPGGPSFRNRNIISPRSRNPLCTKSDKSESSSKQKTICTKITLIHTQFEGPFIMSTLTNHFTHNFVTTQILAILRVQCTIFHINNSQQILLRRMLGRRFLATSSRHSHNITAHYLLSHRYSEYV